MAEQSEINWVVILLIILGMVSIVSLISSILIFFTAFQSTSIITTYIFFIIGGLLLGYFIYYVGGKLKGTLGLVLGIVSPLPAITGIFVFFVIMKETARQLSQFAVTPEVGGYGEMISIFNPNLPNPIVLGALFYLLCNVFIIYQIVKTKNYKYLLWYLIAVAAFLIILGIVMLTTNVIMAPSLF